MEAQADKLAPRTNTKTVYAKKLFYFILDIFEIFLHRTFVMLRSMFIFTFNFLIYFLKNVKDSLILMSAADF